MITFALALSVIVFFLISFTIAITYNQELKKNIELFNKLKKINSFLEVSKNLTNESRGYYKYTYLDTVFNLENTINIPFEIERFSLKHDKVLIRFLFKELFNENERKGVNIIFDENTIKFLKMVESQWYDVDSENIVWEDITSYSKEPIYDAFKVKELPEIELTSYEKQDINGFLKFSTISEETKMNIKKILNL
jgi:hypothetical protein